MKKRSIYDRHLAVVEKDWFMTGVWIVWTILFLLAGVQTYHQYRIQKRCEQRGGVQVPVPFKPFHFQCVKVVP